MSKSGSNEIFSSEAAEPFWKSRVQIRGSALALSTMLEQMFSAVSDDFFFAFSAV